MLRVCLIDFVGDVCPVILHECTLPMLRLRILFLQYKNLSWLKIVCISISPLFAVFEGGGGGLRVVLRGCERSVDGWGEIDHDSNSRLGANVSQHHVKEWVGITHVVRLANPMAGVFDRGEAVAIPRVWRA